jgi:hypothetical protein
MSMNALLNRLLGQIELVSMLELPAGLSPWIVLDGVAVSPAALADKALALGYSVDRLAPLRLIVTDGAETVRLVFEPSVDEVAVASVAAALIADGTVVLPVELEGEPSTLVERILDAGWVVPAESAALASVATRLLLDRVGVSAARWELEVALNAEPSVLELARRVDSLDR